MSGNVWEWVEDWYSESYYGSSPSTDPQGPSSGTNRVRRGGAFSYTPAFLRVSLRLDFAPNLRASNLGFRIARTAE